MSLRTRLDALANAVGTDVEYILARLKSVGRETFGQEGDATVSFIGVGTVSNYPRKPLPLWVISNDNVLSSGMATTARLYYYDSNNVAQEIAHDLTIAKGTRETLVSIPTNLLPVIPAGKKFGAKATVAPASSGASGTAPTYFAGTSNDTDDTPANSLTLTVPSGYVGKIALVVVASTTAGATMPATGSGEPTWTYSRQKSDTAGSVHLTAAWKPILAGETTYTVSFAGMYASAGAVIVLENYDQLVLADPDYVVEKINDTFVKTLVAPTGDSTVKDKSLLLEFVATRSSSAEFPQVIGGFPAGTTKILETSSARPASANVGLAILAREQAVAGAVAQPTLTSPFNSRWVVSEIAVNASDQTAVGAYNLTVSGEMEITL